jgi:hypothetical protein
MNESSNTAGDASRESTWQKPELRQVGNVGDVLQFPGNGKVSNATEDMGDTPYKPSGLEPK